MTQTPEFLSRKQIAQMLGVQPLTIMRWEREGKLPAIHVSSRTVRYSRESVQHLIDSAKVMQP